MGTAPASQEQGGSEMQYLIVDATVRKRLYICVLMMSFTSSLSLFPIYADHVSQVRTNASSKFIPCEIDVEYYHVEEENEVRE